MEPPWNDLAAEGIRAWGKGAVDYIKEHIGLSAADAAEWIQENEPPENAAEGEKPTERRGAKPKYEWPDFWREVVMIANKPDGLPKTQADLERTMLAWCFDTWGKEPSTSSVRKRLAPLYR